MCYCETNSKKLSDGIAALEEQIPQIEASIKEAVGSKAQLEADLVTTDRIRHVDLHRLLIEFRLIPRISIVLKNELLVERAELRAFHRDLRRFSGRQHTSRFARRHVEERGAGPKTPGC